MPEKTAHRDPHARIADLKAVAESLSIDIEFSDLSDSDVAVQSGYCKINGQKTIILDKNLPPEMQAAVLLEILGNFNLDDTYIASWIREHFENDKSS